MMKSISAFVFGEPTLTQLPERVRLSIEKQQREAEVLIGWAQLALVVFFLTLYTVAPKTSVGTPFAPVPYVLAAYFLFTVLRLMLAYKGILPFWFLYGSVVIDIGLLMALMWSFHLQYEQPAPFYLKAPTLLYVFIFISLRSLRFEPSFVLAAGVTAAIGWFALVWYAIDYMAPMDVVTRDYVLYLTSNRVLIGAEVDKILSILVVTAVLSVALVRGRRLLIHAVNDAMVAKDLSRFVSPEIASQITTADKRIEPGDGEVKLASVLFCDIEGFSGISERLQPQELIQTLNDYFAAVSQVIDRHGGVITQFQGDAMLITFNTANPDPEHHAANALRTAIGIQDVVTGRRFGPGIEMRTRCGVNTGQLIAGAVGTADRLLFTVHGDEVNIAARLEQLNKEHGTYILVTEQTIRAATEHFAAHPIGEVNVRGRGAPVKVWAVDAAGDDVAAQKATA